MSIRTSQATTSRRGLVAVFYLLTLILPTAVFAQTVCDIAEVRNSDGDVTTAAVNYVYATKTTANGATVCNPSTTLATTVASRLQDPTGAPTAGENAWVETADGYHFFVKSVGDIYYADGTYYTDTTANPNLVVASTNYPFSGSMGFSVRNTGTNVVTNLDGVQDATEWAASTTPPLPDDPFVTAPSTANSSSTGYRYVVMGDGGSNGRAGALFVSAVSGGGGQTGPAAPNVATVIGNYNTTNIGVEVASIGGKGGNGGNGYLGAGGANGGNSGAGGVVDLSYSGNVTTTGNAKHGIFALSRSGEGGNAGTGYLSLGAGSGNGGAGSDGGSVTVSTSGTTNIETNGIGAHGIYGLSVGANGGTGGSSFGIVGNGGSGGVGGKGGVVSVTNNGDIVTNGVGSHGILAQSIGGGGGDAGTAGGLVAFANVGDAGGSGSNASGSNGGIILTNADFSRGIFVQSIGGGGGSGGDSGGIFALGGTGAGGGSAGTATATNSGTISTFGIGSDGIMVQSIAGSGGAGGGSGGLVAVGGSGDEGGNGNEVSATNSGSITTRNVGARGIVAQSIGGGGGDGGSSGGLVSIGGGGKGGGTGGNVTVTNLGSIDTNGVTSFGILAQSIGGGGGNGGSTGGMVSVGGSGSVGGAGGNVTVRNDGEITTRQADSTALMAQSIGGGGGNGGSATSVGLFAAVGIGGDGGKGGAGGVVNLTLSDTDTATPSRIFTQGDRSFGVLAQSVGGGGGNGGGATSVAVGFGGALAVSIGGDAGVAGDGGTVSLNGSGSADVETRGADSTGVLLQSVGGGGGNGGFAISVAAAAGPVAGGISVGLGGDGGAGGAGGAVTNSSYDGKIITRGTRSSGMIIQSVGGGGGNGGTSVAAAAVLSLGASGSVTVGVGGSGASGGAGGTVRATNTADVETFGTFSDAMVVQSIGGGGGNGGGAISASIGFSGGASAGINVGVGGNGGAASAGGAVTLETTGDLIRTAAQGSQGVVVQSIGGGGGNGGYAIAAGANFAAGAAATVTVGLGGKAGGGGVGGTVSALIGADVSTGTDATSTDSTGVVVQSIGGGGGTGGFSVSAGISGAGGAAGGVNVGLGGSGGSGGSGGLISRAEVNGSVTTLGDRSGGVLVQSIGGGGGNGGFNVSATVAGAGAAAGTIGVGLGGRGGAGGAGGAVNADIYGNVTTSGAQSAGVVTQSIGGGGGNGGFNITAGASGAGIGSGSIAVGLGGNGGTGAHASNVTTSVTGAVLTAGADSTGVLAQSVGGSGGNGGFNVSGTLSGAGTAAGAVSVGLGGSGGLAATAGDVFVVTTDTITTSGVRSSGLVAQSVGGGGGNGGFNVSANASGAGVASGGISVGLGGSGAGGGSAANVTVITSGNIATDGDSSTGLVAQSIGGGGGNGGFNVSATASGAGTAAGAINVGLGGQGGGAGNGGIVDVALDATVTTSGQSSTGVLAQSVGGSGGNGGFNVSAGIVGGGTAAGSIDVGLGGNGGTAANAASVTLTSQQMVFTDGQNSTGIVAQSIGGGGGNGGFNVTASLAGAGTAAGTIGVGLGGKGAAGGEAGNVNVMVNGPIVTLQDNSGGLVAQSLGGGGGNGGFNITAGAAGAGTGAGAIAVGLGGAGGTGSDGANVVAVVTGQVDTFGKASTGVLAQSIGGGGGNGGFNVSGTLTGAGTAAGGITVGLGGKGGTAAAAGSVNLRVDETVTTRNDDSSGVVAQSIGGGGGNGGFNVSASLTAAGTGAGAIGVGLGGSGAGGGQAGAVIAEANGAINTQGFSSSGFIAQSLGGGGGNGGFNVTANAAGAGTGAAAIGVGLGGQGGGAGDGNTVDAIVTGTVTTRGDAATGILAQSIGGSGGSGGFNVTASLSGAGTGAVAVGVGLGGEGGVAANAAKVTLRSDETVMTQGHSASGIVAQSIGGGGGAGGFNVTANLGAAGTGAAAIGVGLGGNGAGGGQAGDVDATSNGRIFTDGVASSGFVAQSIGGGGGNGGFNVTAGLAAGGTGAAGVGVGLGGQGAGGGNGARVDAAVNATVLTLQDQSTAVLAQSVGGGGGNGGFNVTATLAGGGTGAAAIGVGLGGSGAGGGDGGIVSLTMTDDIKTRGNNSAGAIAQSIGGGGGNGGFNVTATLAGGGKGAISAAVGLGGSGAGGGNAADVTNVAQSNILTAGDTSTGLLVQSVGGGGGNGGLNVSANITVAGKAGGGAAVGLGGSAGVGGFAGNVRSTLTGDVDTTGTDSSGVIVQSLGGGGGNGGLNISASITASGKFGGSAAVGLGGSGGAGGAAGTAFNQLTGNVVTRGENAGGIFVQSAGGGGGSGGVNVSAAVNLSADAGGAIAVGLGGSGGSGGDGETATSIVVGDITTLGNNAAGLTVQSLGGGGGNGGLNIAGAVNISGATGGAVSVGVGGFGGGGGMADEVNSDFTGDAQTTGNNAAALIAQSLGGGGGNGATNVSGAISVAKDKGGAIGIGVGGFGGGGGQAGSVRQAATGQFVTRGDDSTGIFTQSLGGGGGSGGTNITAALNISRDTGGAIGIGVGGFGGGGQDAGDLTQSNVIGGVTTLGARSTAILTQSIGGGGGAGGTNISAAVNLTQNNGGAIGLGLGGFGASAGDGKVVVSTLRSSTLVSGEQSVIDTVGADSIGMLAQSVGGGGGAGGLNVSASVSLSGKSGAAISLGLGGFGGGGGDAGDVTLDAISTITTRGNGADGIFAQSLGGGGGVGGTNISGSLALTKPSGSDTILSISAGVGGFGGGGGDAGDVSVSYDGLLTAVPLTELPDGSFVRDLTSGANGLVAQSIGGGGGNGGTNVSAGLAISSKPGAGQSDRSKSYGLLVGVGGFGGTGGNAGNVAVNVAAGSEIVAHGTGKSGLLAQSVGGGGGNGGLNVSAGIVSDTSLIVGVGGFGGNAGTGGDVNVVSVADIVVTTNPTDLAEPSDEDFLSGLTDIVGADVVETIEAQIDSKGLRRLFIDVGLFKEESNETEGSAGLLAQSIGGGGGNGGLNVSGGIALSKDEKIPSVTFGVGGFGGAGNVSGDVSADHTGTITVAGNWKHGIFAQSIAGGGGNGAMNVTGQVSYAKSEQDRGATDFSVVGGLGGHGGEGADAGNVLVVADGNISATGYHARGIFAQSIGGGGGTGGMNISAVATQNSQPLAMGIGGFGSGGGHAGSVTVQRGNTVSAEAMIVTNGTGGHGIEASSIGGGGGDAGINAVLGFSKTTGQESDSGTAGDPDRKVPEHTGVDASVIPNYNAVLDELEGKSKTPEAVPASAQQTTYSGVIAVGGSAGSAGNAGDVDVDHFGLILTQGDASHGIMGQSIGGGGGNAALNVGQMFNKGSASKVRGFAVGIGGGTGDGGNGAGVDVRNTGDVTTLGDGSYGIFAQSVGGGGGNVGYQSVSNKTENGNISVNIGRTGGTGGTGGNVFASSDGTVATLGDGSHGIFAQSIGNGGGNSSSTSISLSTPGEGDEPGNSYQMSMGLEGGVGGKAGTVGVDASGQVTTDGTAAHGIFAQSVGGGGGTGGGVSSSTGEGLAVAISLGGTGGTGGTGDAVTVTSDALIQTLGDGAIGIMAQSIGGSGGTGGLVKGGPTAFSAVTGLKNTKDIGESYNLSLGGDGGVGMASGTVSVTTAGTILTDGVAAHGVFAQSVGGGGGMGGLVTTGVMNLRAEIASQNTLSIGGSGGTGAVSGEVTVANENSITILGERAVGIFAQSVGGGGGDAQNVSNVVLGKAAKEAANNSILIGGSGGDGAKGADVAVTNGVNGAIATLGVDGYGILAQSIGGGGGTGGSTKNVVADTGASGGSSTEGFNLGLGGSGGTGGSAGAVTVTNAGTVTTFGDNAHGIIAQSVGGGGGIGGSVTRGDLALAQGSNSAPSLAISLGGSGGTGGIGGAVTVTNSGTISVSGEGAYGIFAQSIGGGGGNGGMVVDLSSSTATSGTQTLTQMALGGSGGSGNDSGDVLVNHTGTIIVNSANGYGIFAQSVSGGGGNAGLTIAAPSATIADLVFSTALGARDGATGNVGTVTVNSTGDIILNGVNSQAILSQSVAGGGGSTVTAIALGQVTAETAFAARTASLRVAQSISGTISLGGDDVSGTVAADVAQSHGGDIVTMQDRSLGVVLQSIGGGGGQNASTLDIAAGAAAVLDVRIGATNTSDASGGQVTATRDGNMVTLGDASIANQVQSIGGGGGRMALTAAGEGSAIANLILGSDPSFRNDGGDIALTLSGEVMTVGNNASAQVVQSIGAGGGSASLIGLDRATILLGGQDGSTGDSGDLAIVSAGDILTSGDVSHGFVLQAIGGGGGLVSTDLDAADIALTLSTANSGDGGVIALSSAGNIVVSGDGSVGVLAQSLGGGGGAVDAMFFGAAGGAGAGGAIDLTVQGNILATGAGGIALLAQSEGKDGAGDVAIALDGVIMGGSGPSDDSAAIMIDGGDANRVDLSTDSFLMAANNQIFRTGTGDEVVTLQGQALGNIDLGVGQNSFAIERGATFYAQDTVDLGATGEMDVNGFLVLGGEVSMNADPATGALPSLTSDVSAGAFSVAPLVYQTTKVNGNLTLGATADYIVDVSFRQDGQAGVGSDLIDVTGNGTLNGTIRPVLHKLERALPLVIVDVDGLGFDAGAYVIDTALIDYSIGLNGSTGDGSSIDLVADVNFATANMNLNETNVGLYINDVLNGEGSAELGDLFAVMANFETEEEVIQLMSQLTTGDYASTQISAQRGALGFAQALQTCDRPTTALSTLEDTRCHWLQISGTKYTRDATDNALNFSSYDDGLNGGFRFPLDGQTFVTFGGSHETITVNNGTTFSAKGNRNQFGVAFQTSRGPWEFSGSLSTGRSTYNANRLINIEGNLPDGTQLDATSMASTTQVVSHTNLRFGAGYRHVLAGDQFYIRPGIDVDATRLRSWSAQELGNRYGVSLQDTTQWATTVTASLEMGADTDLGQDVKMRGFLRGEAIFGDTDNLYVDARLPGTSASDGSFRNYADVDSRSTRLTVGATFNNTRNNTFADVTYERQKGDRSRSSTFGVKLGINF